MSALHLHNKDCMEVMAGFPDKHFDLAIVDPPYGAIDHTCNNGILYKKPVEHIPHRRTENSTAYSWAVKYGLHKTTEWDIAPSPEYFTELFRVSKQQIIWGGNYFDLPPSRNFIVWRKTSISETFSMAMAEYAWTSIAGNAKVIEYPPQNKDRFHPTQKPVFLYQKLLQWYAGPGYKILDTHLGSGSSAIACIDCGLDFTGCETNTRYFEAATERIRKHRLSGNLFKASETAVFDNQLLEGINEN